MPVSFACLYTCWIKYDLGVGRERAISRLRIKPRIEGDWGGVKTFVLEGSLNNHTWYKLYDGENKNNNDWSNYDFVNKTNYRYYRITIKDGYNVSWAAISEIEMLDQGNCNEIFL